MIIIINDFSILYKIKDVKLMDKNGKNIWNH